MFSTGIAGMLPESKRNTGAPPDVSSKSPAA
jgi:hypothetical protein